nr:BTB/POZ and MATH domain-containing protein 1-like [Aegilops tauschii subsp. strangulata]
MALNGGSITVRCVLTVMKGHQTSEDVHTVLVPLPQSNLHRHFLDMLKGGQGADVTFTVGGQSFLAHRCVLAARSSVFKAELLAGEMNETLVESIKMDDMEPSIFEALLHFIYTDSLPDDRHEYNNRHTQMQHLLVAADRYGIERLMAMCEGQLCRNIKVQTVATTLALAEQHHCVHLKKACLAFLSSRDVRQAIKETDGFKHLVTSCSSVILEIFDKPPPHS